MNRVTQILIRLYVPVASLVIVILIGRWLEPWANFDPLTVAQNSHLSFQRGEEEASGRTSSLTPAEARLADAVVRDGLNATGLGPRIMFIGDSQTMAIMDREPGDMTTPQWLQVLLARDATASRKPLVVLGSLPNLSMPEFLVQLIAANNRPNGRLNAVILCVTLRQWRGLIIRPSELKLAQQTSIESDIKRLVETNPDLAQGDAAILGALTSTESSPNVSSDRNPKARFADYAEQRLDLWLDSHVPLFGFRDHLRARISLLLVTWRNRIFHITTASARPVPRNTYESSLQIVELALRYARAQRIMMVLYLSPIRSIEPNPDIPSDVTRFRKDVLHLCAAYKATCLDYANLVPEKLWTNYPVDDPTTSGGLDFVHFTGAAHKLVAKQIMNDVGAQLLH